MNHRREFAGLLDLHSIKTACEVGVGEGFFTRQLLESKSLEVLWLIDSWSLAHEKPWLETVKQIAADDDRVKIVPFSLEVSIVALPECEFFYIDTPHEYQVIRSHIDLCLPKCTRILAGHDYALYNAVANAPNGVVLAVEETFGEHVNVTGAGPTQADRLRVAYEATLPKDYGPWADDLPSWWVHLEDFRQ